MPASVTFLTLRITADTDARHVIQLQWYAHVEVMRRPTIRLSGLRHRRASPPILVVVSGADEVLRGRRALARRPRELDGSPWLPSCGAIGTDHTEERPRGEGGGVVPVGQEGRVDVVRVPDHEVPRREVDGEGVFNDPEGLRLRS